MLGVGLLNRVSNGLVDFVDLEDDFPADLLSLKGAPCRGPTFTFLANFHHRLVDSPDALIETLFEAGELRQDGVPITREAIEVRDRGGRSLDLL